MKKNLIQIVIMACFVLCFWGAGVEQNAPTIEMVFVKGGTFTMGCTEEQGDECDENEIPAHPVTLSDFYIGKYEVTQKQWEMVMGDNPSRYKGDDMPAGVGWNNVQKFISTLNSITGMEYRLPTEAEWEYAARGGVRSEGYKYSGSNNIDDVAWHSRNTFRPKPVGTKQPNELGIYDMSGNVDEWVSDWFGDYTPEAKTDPTGPLFGARSKTEACCGDANSEGASRLSRGGFYMQWFVAHRVSHRWRNNPDHDDIDSHSGFRLVLVPNNPILR